MPGNARSRKLVPRNDFGHCRFRFLASGTKRHAASHSLHPEKTAPADKNWSDPDEGPGPKCPIFQDETGD